MPRRCTPETAVKGDIKRWLNLFGWRCWHHLQGLGSYPGMPDIEAIKRVNGSSVTLYIECKASKGIQSEKQKRFQAMIEQEGGHYILARSSKDIEDYLSQNHIQQYRRLV